MNATVMIRTLVLSLLSTLALAACTGEGAAPSTPPPAPSAAGAEPVRQTAPAGSLPATASAATDVDAARPVVTVYKSPTCGCCTAWAEHMREAGFPVETVDVGDMSAVKRRYGIPPGLQSCHTAVVDGYAIEGHVPAEDVKRLLAEAPEAGGLAVPGMPIGSPGMEQGDTVEPYEVLLVDDGQATVFARH